MGGTDAGTVQADIFDVGKLMGGTDLEGNGMVQADDI
jgi:hypothetical protein